MVALQKRLQLSHASIAHISDASGHSLCKSRGAEKADPISEPNGLVQIAVRMEWFSSKADLQSFPVFFFFYFRKLALCQRIYNVNIVHAPALVCANCAGMVIN